MHEHVGACVLLYSYVIVTMQRQQRGAVYSNTTHLTKAYLQKRVVDCTFQALHTRLACHLPAETVSVKDGRDVEAARPTHKRPRWCQ